MTVYEYFGDWAEVIDIKEADRILKRLSASSHTICPEIKNVFKAFHLCPLKSLRVVILGQDPYPNLKTTVLNGLPSKIPVATGIAFANSTDTPKQFYSPSLDVLRESVIDYTIPHGTINFDPSLEKWEAQGVLLLNTALTCETEKVGSHSLLWRPFISKFLLNLSKCCNGIVYVLMGSVAQSMEPYINPRLNHVIRCRHPSYYARTGIQMPPDIWRKVNAILEGQNGYGIKWFQENIV